MAFVVVLVGQLLFPLAAAVDDDDSDDGDDDEDGSASTVMGPKISE